MKNKAIFVNIDEIVNTEFYLTHMDEMDWTFKPDALKTIRDLLDKHTKLVLIHNAFKINEGSRITPIKYRKFINDVIENITLFTTNQDYKRKDYLNSKDIIYDVFIADHPGHPYAFPNVLPAQKIAEDYDVDLTKSKYLKSMTTINDWLNNTDNPDAIKNNSFCTQLGISQIVYGKDYNE